MVPHPFYITILWIWKFRKPSSHYSLVHRKEVRSSTVVGSRGNTRIAGSEEAPPECEGYQDREARGAPRLVCPQAHLWVECSHQRVSNAAIMIQEALKS
jgi:hypothetical protein